MNLLITDVCNRSCPYCFARDKVDLAGESVGVRPEHISLEAVGQVLDFLERSGRTKFKVLGGEPTVHPRVRRIVAMALERRFDVTLFTNGLWNGPVLDYFRGPDTQPVRFVVNVNEPDGEQPQALERLYRTLEVAGARATLGFNIYHEAFDLLFLGELIERFSLDKKVRLGLASPIVGAANVYAEQASLPAIGRRLVQQMRLLEQRDVLIQFDCGFPLCMFAEEDLGALVSCSTGFQSLCGSVIDVGPDLSVWPCFPLSAMYNRKLTDFATLGEVEAYYESVLAPLRSMGSRDECLQCKYLVRGQCSGGCMARGILRWQQAGDGTLFGKLGVAGVAC